MLNFTNYDAQVARFRTGSPNIAAAFDELRKLLVQLDAQPAGYTITGAVADRSFDARTATQNEIANVLGTLILDLRK